jgi:hypothetical protein
MTTRGRLRSALAVAALLSTAAACDIVDPQDDVNVTIDDATLVVDSAGSTVDVLFTVENGRTDSIEVATCEGAVNAPLERRVGAGWLLIGAGSCQVGGIRTIAPGDTAGGHTAVGPAESGTYRVALAYRTTPEGVQGSTRSASFTVTQ